MTDLKAALLGYFLFSVVTTTHGGQSQTVFFWRYSSALLKKNALVTHGDGPSIAFNGWNVWLWLIGNKHGPWRGFYLRWKG